MNLIPINGLPASAHSKPASAQESVPNIGEWATSQKNLYQNQNGHFLLSTFHCARHGFPATMLSLLNSHPVVSWKNLAVKPSIRMPKLLESFTINSANRTQAYHSRDKYVPYNALSSIILTSNHEITLPSVTRSTLLLILCQRET